MAKMTRERMTQLKIVLQQINDPNYRTSWYDKESCLRTIPDLIDALEEAWDELERAERIVDDIRNDLGINDR